MRALAAVACVVLCVAGCDVIMGIDRDYSFSSQGGQQTAGGGGSTSTGGEAGQGGSGTGGGAGSGGQVGTVVYEATVADCVDLTAPNPDLCADPAKALWIDAPDVQAYLRFELDGAIAGATVLSAKLRLRVGTFTQAQGDTTGELWEVEPFTRPDLFNGPPATIGSILAGDQGAADPGATVEWAVPLGLVAANTPVYLGLVPLSANSVGYVNLDGANPPRLVVRYE